MTDHMDIIRTELAAENERRENENELTDARQNENEDSVAIGYESHYGAEIASYLLSPWTDF